jgi:tripartite-type tricarboxylate transporter receptor subunit TctC
MLRVSRWLLCCSTLAGIVWSAPIAAQETPAGYPSRPIRLVVSSVAGGAMDLKCRTVGQMLTERWGQSVVVDNRSGGATVIATEIAAKSVPDGYTLFGGSDNLRIVGVTKRVPFDVRKAFEPVAGMATQPYVLLVIPSLPARNFKELVAYSATHPLTYGSSGVGTTAHLGLESLFARTSGKFVHVPYKGGAQSLLALMSGEIHMYPGLVLSAGTAIKQGKARALATLIPTRIPALPDVPSIAEQGFPGVKITNSYILYAPAGTSKRIINAINRVVGEFIGSPQMAQKLAAEGSQPAERMTPEELKVQFARDYEETERQVKQLKVKVY